MRQGQVRRSEPCGRRLGRCRHDRIEVRPDTRHSSDVAMKRVVHTVDDARQSEGVAYPRQRSQHVHRDGPAGPERTRSRRQVELVRVEQEPDPETDQADGEAAARRRKAAAARPLGRTCRPPARLAGARLAGARLAPARSPGGGRRADGPGHARATRAARCRPLRRGAAQSPQGALRARRSGRVRRCVDA